MSQMNGDLAVGDWTCFRRELDEGIVDEKDDVNFEAVRAFHDVGSAPPVRVESVDGMNGYDVDVESDHGIVVEKAVRSLRIRWICIAT